MGSSFYGGLGLLAVGEGAYSLLMGWEIVM